MRKVSTIILIFPALFLISAVTFSPPVQVAPGPALPEGVVSQHSNNNLDIVNFNGRLFLGFRTAPNHFAGTKTYLYIISSVDQGKTWDYEAEVFMGSDMREPRFLVIGDKLMFYYFQAGKNPFAFAPKDVHAMERKGFADWSEPRPIFGPECVLWRAKERRGEVYITTYCSGGMYTGGNADIEVKLMTTENGYDLELVDPVRPYVLKGGSETAFEFDETGNLYAVNRNETGDGTSWGGKVCRAPADDVANWECKVTPYKYDSPIMFRHKDEFYIIARRNIDGKYDKGNRWMYNPIEGLYYLARYWWTKKRTALYKLNTETLEISHVLDFPSKGDTSFPGLVKLNDNQYLMFNYTSPLDGPDRVWMTGQLVGTVIYSTVITFEE